VSRRIFRIVLDLHPMFSPLDRFMASAYTRFDTVIVGACFQATIRNPRTTITQRYSVSLENNRVLVVRPWRPLKARISDQDSLSYGKNLRWHRTTWPCGPKAGVIFRVCLIASDGKWDIPKFVSMSREFPSCPASQAAGEVQAARDQV
jgi:hypothetical protein